MTPQEKVRNSYSFWQTCPRRAPNVKNRGPIARLRDADQKLCALVLTLSACASLWHGRLLYAERAFDKALTSIWIFAPSRWGLKAGTSSQNSFNLLNHTNVSLLDAAFGSNGRAQSGL
jgi:hypothetical protein